MASRIKLHEEFEELLGNRNVYFQPPKNTQLSYPCIIYKLNKMDTKHANDRVYKKNNAYQVTLIHKDPDNTIKDKLLMFPKTKFNNFFVNDNLNHYVYTIYY